MFRASTAQKRAYWFGLLFCVVHGGYYAVHDALVHFGSSHVNCSRSFSFDPGGQCTFLAYEVWRGTAELSFGLARRYVIQTRQFT
jgi:hypothetical protein